MSSIRIRYVKTGDGMLKSFRNITSQRTKALYSIDIDTKTMMYRIKNVHNGHIVKRGGENVNSLVVIKRYVKRDLKKLGVKFEMEIRDRSYGLVKKEEKND